MSEWSPLHDFPDSEPLLPDDVRPAQRQPRHNPFADSETTADSYTPPVNIGGSILDAAEVHGPEKKQNPLLDQLAKDACDYLCSILINSNASNQPGVMPQTGELGVIQSTLDRMERTPLAVGWGKFPADVITAWNNFVKRTTRLHRQQSNLGDGEFASLRLEIPNWLQDLDGFDILANARLLDVVIVGDINGEIARGAAFSRITIEGDIDKKGKIGINSERSTFVIKGNMNVEESFSDAQNIDVQIEGTFKGAIGIVSNSRISCKNTTTNQQQQAVCNYRGDSTGTGFIMRRSNY